MRSTEELVQAVLAGETPAFEALVRLYERAATLTAFAILHDFHAAQDVAQEAFLIAYEKLPQLRDLSSFGGWVLQITRRQASAAGRKTGSNLPTTELTDAIPAHAAEWIEPYRALVEHLGRLPEQEHVVMVLRHVEGRSVQEIATTLGRPVGTVTKQLSRAVERLRSWLVEVES
ncbi:MAG TPA: sigma-70 family RNA polymerase sigma factor [Pirellulales bacterium]|jgi:RNA polymerase sigma-70 factor (ECF subfamily)